VFPFSDGDLSFPQNTPRFFVAEEVRRAGGNFLKMDTPLQGQERHTL
jgi:hypothetical protein